MEKETYYSNSAEKPPKQETNHFNRDEIIYVSDLHGDFDHVIDKIATLLPEQTPAHEKTPVVFLGDVVGLDDLADLQNNFWNVKNNLHNPTILKQMLRVLINKEITLGEPRHNFTDYDLTMKAHEIEQMRHSNHYFSSLNTQTKQFVADNYYLSATNFFSGLKQLSDEQASFVPYLIKGNQEAYLPWLFNKDKNDNAVYDDDPLIEIAREVGVNYVTDIEVLTTSNTIQLLLSVNALAKAANDVGFIDDVKTTITRAKVGQEQQKLVFVSHVPPDMEKHTGRSPYQENLLWETGLNNLITALQPEEVIYGHAHRQLINQEGQEVTTYRDELKNIQATYLPFKDIIAKTFSGVSN